ncbi:MAG: triose-phosphate isomerase [Erysipelotrichaceae bacterium]
MRKKIIIGNWKLNKTIAEAVDFIQQIDPLVYKEVDFGIAASYLALQASVASAKHLIVAAQNMCYMDNGAFTGEVSVHMLKEVGVKWVILGHSERRQYWNETDESVNLKAKKALENGLNPIVCVGETLSQFEAGETEKVVRKQTKACLEGLTAQQVASLVLAYEPVWAIGTGKNATKEIAQNTCALIRNEVKTHFGKEAADSVRIQYGGSVKPENIKEYLSEADIDGALIGGASLKVDSFTAIINALKA